MVDRGKMAREKKKNVVKSRVLNEYVSSSRGLTSITKGCVRDTFYF